MPEGSNGSLMHYWYVGMDAYMLIVPCFVEATMQDDPWTAQCSHRSSPPFGHFEDIGMSDGPQSGLFPRSVVS